MLELAQRYGATNVRVFGSVARGQDSEASDIDLLVDVPADFTLLDMSGLTVELSEVLGVQVDVATVELLREEIRPDVLASAVPL